MKTIVTVFAKSATAAALLCMTCCAVAGSTTTAPAANRANEIVKALEAKIPESVFEIPATTAEGRNPFFPSSRADMPQPVVKTITNVPPPAPTYDLVLNGITSPPKRTAMVNGRTFEPGEEGDVKLPDGTKIRIKCEDILDEAVIIIVGGVRQELRMRFAL
jgi:hypothetical protein